MAIASASNANRRLCRVRGCSNEATEHRKTRCYVHSNRRQRNNWSESDTSSTEPEDDTQDEWSDIEEEMEGVNDAPSPPLRLSRRAFGLVYGREMARQQVHRLRTARALRTALDAERGKQKTIEAAVRALLERAESTDAMLKTLAFRFCRMVALCQAYHHDLQVVWNRLKVIEEIAKHVDAPIDLYTRLAEASSVPSWIRTEVDEQLERHFMTDKLGPLVG